MFRIARHAGFGRSPELGLAFMPILGGPLQVADQITDALPHNVDRLT